MNTAKTKISFLVNQGEYNGLQCTEWFVDEVLVFSTGTDQRITELLEFDVTLPCCLTIKIAGKNINQDTEVIDGKITQDKFIEIKKLCLARVPVKVNTLIKICEYTDDTGQLHNSAYWHRNGEVQIKFSESDPISWLLTNNH